MNKLRKIFTISVMAITVFSMSVVVAPQADAAASAGDLIKMDGLSSVYYLGSDGKRYVFPNEKTYFSWYSDFSSVVTIPQSELESYSLAANVTVRPGTQLVKITTNPNVYAVTNGGNLVLVPSEAVASALYGSAWARRVIDVPDAFFTNYKISGASVSATAYPQGTLIQRPGSADIYYVNADSTVSKVESEAAMSANRFQSSNVITTAVDFVLPVVGAPITGAVADIINTSSSASGVGVTPGAGTGLTVALSSATAATATYIRDTGAVVAQAVAPFATFNFTAANDGAVKVTSVKFTRGGISADTDLGTLYLYDGDTMIAENSSFSQKVVTFNNTDGLFTVAAGTTKAITLRADISAANASVSGITFGINSAADVVASGASVSGSFPATGNQMAVGTVADLGYLNIATVGASNFPATLDPGKTGEELFKFNATANDQDMVISRIKYTVVGTVSTTDLANFALNVSGTAIGSTVASMNTSKEVIFDFATPYKITAGQTKTITLTGDVVNGSGRAFKFTIRKVGDINVMDNSYGINVAPLYNNAAFTLIDADSSGDGTNINNGTMTVAVAADSATGNIAAGATGVSMAKFTYKANGEDIKVNYVNVSVNEESSDLNLRNGKLYMNGSQVGSTDTVVTDAATVVFTVNQIVKAGTTATLEYKADAVNDADGLALANNQTVVVSLVAGTTDATGQSSLANVATAAATARTLTVKTGTLTAAKNLSVGDYSSTNPVGTKSATDRKVASFVLTAGAGEGVTVTQIVVGDKDNTDTHEFGANFQNLVLKHGTAAISAVKGTLAATDGADFSFTISPAITIAAGQQYVVDAYADVLSGAPDYGSAATGLEFVSVAATGNSTSADASYSTATDLQALYIAANGTIAVTVDSDTPLSQQLVMGANAEFARFKFEETSKAENLTITEVTITDTLSAAATGSISNISLVDKDSGTVYGTASSLAAGGTATISGLSIVIPAGNSKTIKVMVDAATSPNAISKSTHVLSVSAFAGMGASSGVSLTTGTSTGTAGTMTLVKAKLVITKASTTLTPSRSTETKVAEFDLTNSSNVANQAVTLSDLALNVSLSGGTWTTSTKTLKVYKNSISNDNLLGYVANLESVAFGGWTGGDTNPAASSLKDLSIASNATVKLIVVADTTGAPTGAGVTGTISVTVPSASGVKWEDGVSTGASAVTTIDTLPVSASLSGI